MRIICSGFKELGKQSYIVQVPIYRTSVFWLLLHGAKPLALLLTCDFHSVTATTCDIKRGSTRFEFMSSYKLL